MNKSANHNTQKKKKKGKISRKNFCLFACVVMQQEKAELKRELWRIEDVMGGLSASKANYKITVDSIQNPGEIRLFADDIVVANESFSNIVLPIPFFESPGPSRNLGLSSVEGNSGAVRMFM